MTKTLMIQEQLRYKIRNERLAPGSKILPEFELAKEFGVSRNTVRTALAALRDEGLLEGRPRVGTVVAANQYGNTILVVANRNEIVSPYGYWSRNLLVKLQEQIKAMGYQSDLLLTHGSDIDDTAQNLRDENQSLLKRFAGIVSITAVDHRLYELFKESGMPPWVGINIVYSHHPELLWFDYSAVLDQVKMLFNEQGIDDIAVMGLSHDDVAQVNSWEQPFSDNLLKKFFNSEEKIHDPGYNFQICQSHIMTDAVRAFETWYAKKKRPGALYVADDSLFEAISHMLLDQRIELGRDLSLISFANTDRFFYYPQPVTCVGFDVNDVSAQLLNLWQKRRNGENDECVILRAKVFVRQGKSISLQ